MTTEFSINTLNLSPENKSDDVSLLTEARKSSEVGDFSRRLDLHIERRADIEEADISMALPTALE